MTTVPFIHGDLQCARNSIKLLESFVCKGQREPSNFKSPLDLAHKVEVGRVQLLAVAVLGNELVLCYRV